MSEGFHLRPAADRYRDARHGRDRTRQASCGNQWRAEDHVHHRVRGRGAASGVRGAQAGQGAVQTVPSSGNRSRSGPDAGGGVKRLFWTLAFGHWGGYRGRPPGAIPGEWYGRLAQRESTTLTSELNADGRNQCAISGTYQRNLGDHRKTPHSSALCGYCDLWLFSNNRELFAPLKTVCALAL